MSKTQSIAAKPASAVRPAPQPVHTFRRLRVLAWGGSVLLASHAYTLLSADMSDAAPQWRIVAAYRPAWWRNVTASSRLTYRLFDDGFQALAALPSGHVVASVPDGIASLAPGDTEFHITHQSSSRTHRRQIVAARDGQIFWSGYQEISGRKQPCIYLSPDRGLTWEVAHVLPTSVAGIQGLVHDDWANCLWILADGEGANCRVFRASLDFRVVEVAISGSEARMGACIPMRDAIYFGSHNGASDNHVLRLGRNGSLVKAASIAGPCVSACLVGTSMFFSTAPNPSNSERQGMVNIYRSPDGDNWEKLLAWREDFWPALFQSGCAFLAAGKNSTDLLAVSTVGVSGLDLQSTMWRI
jgi:hypothetical protein